MPEVTRYSTDSPHEDSVGFSRAIRIGDRVLTSLSAPIPTDGSVPSDTEAQARLCVSIVDKAIRMAGAVLEDVIRVEIHFTPEADVRAIDQIYSEFFGEVRPVIKMLPVLSLEDPRWKLELEVEAMIGASVTAAN